MKKEETKFQFYIYTFIGSFVLALIVWPLFDIIFEKKVFHYSFISHVIMPLIFAIIYSLIETLLFIRKKKKSH